ncbi:hypothetical protein JMJ35_010583 [Cladonia borealis]|uniref:Berberine/berberine-like domain-containing protein n=1 Tax=Cladonia borealis TaxID=184061 RepID=A0AA39QPS1_9LECA|nr:hypothetical protein JMJ35_010583 [Cladonia borealis]
MKEGLFTALGNGNIVGVTGFVLARLVSAKGELIEATQHLRPDLLWALCGAGHFFRLVTQLVIKVYLVSLLGTKNGNLCASTFVFHLDSAKDVATVMEPLMDDSRYATSGLIMIMAPPLARKPSILISLLYDLKPLVAKGSQVPIQNISDRREAIDAKGDFKRFGIVGLRRFDIESFLRTIEVWKELVTDCPNAIDTAFNFQWDSKPVKTPSFDSAMCLHDTRFYQNNLIWHTDPKNRGTVDEYNERCLAIMRGPNTGEWADYQNATRSGPIELRFRGKDRLARLQRLKKEWDPTGVFTTQLLE